MSVYRIQYGGIVGKPINYSEFLCDSIEDISLLPTNSISTNTYNTCSIGSIAYVNGIKYILNNNGIWEELQHLDDEDVNYEELVNSLINYSFTQIDDKFIYKLSRSKRTSENDFSKIDAQSITTLSSSILYSSLIEEINFPNLIDLKEDGEYFLGGYLPNLKTINLPNVLTTINFSSGVFPKLETLNIDNVAERSSDALSSQFDYSYIIDALNDENSQNHEYYTQIYEDDEIPNKAPIKNISIKYWKEIGNDEFKDLVNLEYVDARNAYICGSDNNNPFSGCTNLKGVNINNVKNVCDSIFKNCSYLEELYCKNLTIISSNMCYACNKLTKINSNATSVGNNAFQNCKGIINVNLPNATSVGTNAFRNCTNLTDISMPNAINIGGSAFRYCTSLESIYLANATSIGGNAFSYCNILKNISLPNANSIDGSAFYECSGLTSISLPNADSIGSYAFLNCTNLTNVSLPNATSIGNNAFYNCTSLIDISLPSANSVGDSVFGDCTNLTNVSLPNADSIGERAFYECTSLTDVSLPNANTIGTYAFYACLDLTDINLPSANSIDDSAFNSCTGLTAISLPNATSIGGAVFYYCINLADVSLPNATSIGNSAFSYCGSLTEISLPNVTSIGNSAFNNCTNLEDIYLPNAQNTYSGAPWGAINATIHYNYEFDENGEPMD